MRRALSRKSFSYRVILTPAEEGGFCVAVPALPGCVSEGDSYSEAMRNIREAIRGYFAVCRKYGDPIPAGDVLEAVVRVAV